MKLGLGLGVSRSSRPSGGFGPELVVNGEFDSGVQNWTACRPAVGTIGWSAVFGGLRSTSSITTGAYGASSEAITLNTLKTYRVRGFIEMNDQPSTVFVRIVNNSDMTGSNIYTTNITGSFSVDFTPTEVTMYFGVIAVSTVIGQSYLITEFSIREIL